MFTHLNTGALHSYPTGNIPILLTPTGDALQRVERDMDGGSWTLLEPRRSVEVGRQDRRDGPLLSLCRLRYPASAHSKVSRTIDADSGFASPSGAALGGMVICQGQLNHVVPLERDSTLPLLEVDHG